MGHADPTALTGCARTLQGVSADMSGASHDIHVQARVGGAACGPGPVGPALERFGTAWGAELLAWSCGAETLSATAEENAKQFIAVTGG